jgi:membrane fusion protein, multidrug efflux system
VPYRHYLLVSLRAGLSAIAMVVMATVITACNNSAAEAPPPPPPEVDATQVVTKSVRQWDEFTGRIAAIGAVDIQRGGPSPAHRRSSRRRSTSAGNR